MNNARNKLFQNTCFFSANENEEKEKKFTSNNERKTWKETKLVAVLKFLNAFFAFLLKSKQENCSQLES